MFGFEISSKGEIFWNYLHVVSPCERLQQSSFEVLQLCGKIDLGVRVHREFGLFSLRGLHSLFHDFNLKGCGMFGSYDMAFRLCVGEIKMPNVHSVIVHVGKGWKRKLLGV